MCILENKDRQDETQTFSFSVHSLSLGDDLTLTRFPSLIPTLISACLPTTDKSSPLLLESLSQLKLSEAESMTQKLRSCQDQLEVIIDTDETMALTGDSVAGVPVLETSSKGSSLSSLSSEVVIVRCSSLNPVSIGLDDREEKREEEHLLSTVIEEQDNELLEQDSLEEFIKHETECGILPDDVSFSETPQVNSGIQASSQVKECTSSSSSLVSETAFGIITHDSVSHLPSHLPSNLSRQGVEKERETVITTTVSSQEKDSHDMRKKKHHYNSSSHAIQEEQGLPVDDDPSFESLVALSSPPGEAVKKEDQKEETTSTSSPDSNSKTSKQDVQDEQHLTESAKQANKKKEKESPSETDSLLTGQHASKNPDESQDIFSINCQRQQVTQVTSQKVVVPSTVRQQEDDVKRSKITLKAVGNQTSSSVKKQGDERDQQLVNEKQQQQHQRKNDDSSPKDLSDKKELSQHSSATLSSLSTASTLMSSSPSSSEVVVAKTEQLTRDNLLQNEIENYSRSKLKKSSTSDLTSHLGSSSQIMEYKKSQTQQDIDPSKTVGGNLNNIQSLEEDQLVMDQVVMENLKKSSKSSSEKTFADHFLPSEAKAFFMTSPDNDVVTTLDFETIEVAVDDGIASDASSEKSVNSPSSTSSSKSQESLLSSSSSSSDSKLQQNHQENKTCSSNTLSNKSAKKSLNSINTKNDMIEKRKVSSSSSSSNLSNYGLVSKRSSSIKDLRDKQKDAEVKIAKEIIELKQREDELKLMRQEMFHIQNQMQQQTSSSSSSSQKEEKLLHHQLQKDCQNTGKGVMTTSCSATRSDSSDKSPASCAILTSSSVASVSDVSSVEMDVVSSSCPRSSSPSTNSEVSTTDSVSGRVSVDSLDSSASSAAAKRLVKHQTTRQQEQKQQQPRSIRSMKPYEEVISEASRSKSRSTSHLNESPIEREIRLVKEREEELRRELEMRKQAMQQSMPPNLGDDSSSSKVAETEDRQEQTGQQQTNDSIPAKTTTITTAIDSLEGDFKSSQQSKVPSLSVNEATSDKSTLEVESSSSSSIAPPYSSPKTTSIQKVLATTRIQQEIEEQTLREMALRASGSIKTISQERTDLKVPPTQLGSIASAVVVAANASSNNNPAVSSSMIQESSDVSTPKTE